jgi:hypothetical protein
MEDAELSEWAREHLVYEVDMLIYVTERLVDQKEDMEGNVLLEAFAVHARCLFDFLWGKGNDNYDDDAYAFHFSDEWNGRRGAIPPNLMKIKDDKRFGREVMHLTYERIDGSTDEKVWPVGRAVLEIATALKLFAELARDQALEDETRDRLASLLVEADETGDLIATLPDGALAATGATMMIPSQFRGGTINVRNIRHLEVGS